MHSDARHGLGVLGYLTQDLLARSGGQRISLLQIGANDGRDEDSVQTLLANHPIDAVLCEPLPDTFARLEQTYAGWANVKLAQCAIGTRDGELRMFRIRRGIRDETSKIASFDRHHVETFRRYWQLPAESVVSETVPCKTVRTLLAAFDRRTVDVAVLDTEGMDHLICPQVLDLDPPPSIVQFEYCSSPRKDVRALMANLTARGYRFTRGGLDITAARFVPSPSPA